MSRAPRLLISGYYGAGNLGDEALLAGLLSGLKGFGIEATVAAIDPATVHAQHGVPAVSRSGGLVAALMRHDALVSGGGGLLQDVTSGRSLAYYLAVIALARALGRRVAVHAQSLGPLSPGGGRWVRRVLAGVPLGLRDEPSIALAHRLGMNAVRVADTAILLPPHQGQGDGALVLIPRAGHPAIGDALARVGGDAARVRIVALHHPSDDAEAKRLHARLPGAALVRPTTLAEGRAAFVGARAVLSGRLHGLVLGALAGVSVAGFAYDPKVAGFAASIGAPCWPLDRRGAIADAAVAEAQAFAASPPGIDRVALARERSRADAGVRWLLRDALGVWPHGDA